MSKFVLKFRTVAEARRGVAKPSRRTRSPIRDAISAGGFRNRVDGRCTICEDSGESAVQPLYLLGQKVELAGNLLPIGLRSCGFDRLACRGNRRGADVPARSLELMGLGGDPCAVRCLQELTERRQ